MIFHVLVLLLAGSLWNKVTISHLWLAYWSLLATAPIFHLNRGCSYYFRPGSECKKCIGNECWSHDGHIWNEFVSALCAEASQNRPDSQG